MRIDSHQHFWEYDPERDAWITDEMSVIQRDFMPTELKSILESNEMDGCIAVQADQSENETQFLLDLANEHTFIKGVVGWLDLLAKGLESRIDYFKSNDVFKGVRHILQAEPTGFMLNGSFIEGVSLLSKHDLTYDILTTEAQLNEVIMLIKRLPEMRLVIDHISKPDIKNKSFDSWAGYMKEISAFDHVYVKLSGLSTEADWVNWKPADFTPYIDFCLDHFGSDRLMFGSDWPVCLLGGTYDVTHQAIHENISKLSMEEQKKIFGLNAKKFYNI